MSRQNIVSIRISIFICLLTVCRIIYVFNLKISNKVRSLGTFLQSLGLDVVEQGLRPVVGVKQAGPLIS